LWFDARPPSEEALAAAEALSREYAQCLHVAGVEERVKLELYGAIVDDVVVNHNLTDAHGVALPLGEGFLGGGVEERHGPCPSRARRAYSTRGRPRLEGVAKLRE
jgi:hypothetical protein